MFFARKCSLHVDKSAMLLNLFIYLRIEGGLFSKLGNTPATSPPETLLNFSLVKLEIKNKQQICMLLRYRISNWFNISNKVYEIKAKAGNLTFYMIPALFFSFFPCLKRLQTGARLSFVSSNPSLPTKKVRLHIYLR